MKIFLRDIANRFPEFEFLNYQEDAFFIRFNHDSRDIKENDIFVPIVGDNFDGHDFINDALVAGASISLCENSKYSKLQETDKPIILVDSIQEGLQKIINFAISPITAPVVAITGSTGKTTTKQMLVTILQSQMNVLFSDSFNTVWGNAMLLSDYYNEDVIVLECGMDRKGEIAWHCNSFDPDLGILLNVGHVHAEKLGSIEEVYKEKKNLADYLDKCGKPLILNIDDEWLSKIAQDYDSELLTVGKRDDMEDIDFQFDNVNLTSEGTDFDLIFEDETYAVHINVFGEELAYNAVCAIAAAYQLGLSVDDAVMAIRSFQPNSGRFEAAEFRKNVVIVNDAYNANPTSMRMSIRTFGRLYPSALYHRIVILGDMKELGDVSNEMHSQLGEFVKEFDFEEVFYIGNFFEQFNVGEYIESPDEMAAWLAERLEELKDKKVAILLKASHSLALDNIPEFLRKLGVN